MMQYTELHDLATAAESSKEEGPGIGIPERHYDGVSATDLWQRSYRSMSDILLDHEVPRLLSSSEQTVIAHFICAGALRMVWRARGTRPPMWYRPMPHGELGEECGMVVVKPIARTGRLADHIEED